MKSRSLHIERCAIRICSTLRMSKHWIEGDIYIARNADSGGSNIACENALDELGENWLQIKKLRFRTRRVQHCVLRSHASERVDPRSSVLPLPLVLLARLMSAFSVVFGFASVLLLLLLLVLWLSVWLVLSSARPSLSLCCRLAGGSSSVFLRKYKRTSQLIATHRMDLKLFRIVISKRLTPFHGPLDMLVVPCVHVGVDLCDFGAVSGPSLASLGFSWAIFRSSWPSWGQPGPSWGHPGAIRGQLGTILEPSILGPRWSKRRPTQGQDKPDIAFCSLKRQYSNICYKPNGDRCV
jgi:hypothetical protein